MEKRADNTIPKNEVDEMKEPGEEEDEPPPEPSVLEVVVMEGSKQPQQNNKKYEPTWRINARMVLCVWLLGVIASPEHVRLTEDHDKLGWHMIVSLPLALHVEGHASLATVPIDRAMPVAGLFIETSVTCAGRLALVRVGHKLRAHWGGAQSSQVKGTPAVPSARREERQLP